MEAYVIFSSKDGVVQPIPASTLSSKKSNSETHPSASIPLHRLRSSGKISNGIPHMSSHPFLMNPLANFGDKIRTLQSVINYITF